MPTPAHRPRGRCLIAIFVMLIAGAFAPAAGAADAGTVHLARGAESNFDAYTRSPNTAQQDFMRARYWRMRVYAPYWDSRLSWYRDGWVYQDAYAIYPTSPVVGDHPDWILHDGAGNKLWIQFACGGGHCTQYAADIGNPAFRQWWIAGAKAKLDAGYRGLFVDDVNMAQRVSDGNGTYTMPIDPRTGAPMNEAAWQHYMADFMAEVRAAFPGVEIVHNSIWTVGDGTADLKRQLGSADYIELERGFNDAGIVGGASKFGWQTLAAFIDRRHAAGQGVILDGNADTAAGREYGLANYLLLSSGNDAIANDAASRPDAFWKGFDVDLGAALGKRYSAGGVWRRDFMRGVALVNEPGAPTRTVLVGAGYRNLDGNARTTVTLAPGAGAVLLRDAAPTATTVVTTPAHTTSAPAPSVPSVRSGDGPKHTVISRPRMSGVRVHGTVRGASGGRVRIEVQRRHGRRWKSVRRTSVAVGHSGRYSRALTRLARGRYRVRASYLGTGTARPSRSGYHRFRVRR
jgi:putative glycosyl hydrolase-like family 15 (GHL15) protein